jgi:two-component system phosphate regulon sensor histidine kinase PhoR
MKKTLPVIVILIMLSLFGLVLLQASWLKNLLEVRKVQLFTKVTEAGAGVAVELSKSLHMESPSVNLLRKGFKFGFDLSKVGKPLVVGDRFSQLDINNKLLAAFEKAGLKNLSFDFAVVTDNGDIEMQSRNFVTEYEDTLNNQRSLFAIVPESANDFENLTHFENLIIVVPDYQRQVWNSLKWVIVIAGLLMLIIISAFGVTVKTLLNQKKLSEIKSDFINNMTHE